MSIPAGTRFVGFATDVNLTERKSAYLNSQAEPYDISEFTGSSGTYTPTFTNTTNVTASTPRLCTYSRTGDMVTVSGQFDIDATTGGIQTILTISLPIASAFTDQYQAGGAGSLYGYAASGGFYADATNDKVIFDHISQGTSNNSVSFTFSYQVI